MSFYVPPNPNNARHTSSLDRINKINEKLNNIQSSISSENNPNTKHIEERLISLDQKNFESQEELYKEFSEAKLALSNLIREIDQERAKYEIFYNQRKNYVKNLEKRLIDKLLEEQKERKNMEERLIGLIDNNTKILKNELQKENKNRNDSIKMFRNYIESEVPKIIKEMKN